MNSAARRYVISGLVQGVGFRYWALQRAQERGIVGFVKNLPDGKVEIVGEGTEEALDALKDDLAVGPRFSKVDGVQAEPVPPTGHYTSFSITR